MKLHIRPANDGKHKYTAIFSDPKETIHFGDIQYQDYTQHKNPLRARMYVNRHRKREHWDTARTAGSLSYWLLWSSPNFESNLKHFAERFNLTLE